MKERYNIHSDGVKNSLELLHRKDGAESKTYAIKTSSTIIRRGKLNSGEVFLDLSGGPMIVVGRPLKEADNAVVRSIDKSEGFGYTVTFV